VSGVHREHCALERERLSLRPLTLREANAHVAALHRHHKPTQGMKFAIGAYVGARLVGAVIVGRPVARMVDATRVAEVTRLVTDGTPNACSLLYAAAARAAAAMGYEKIQTYILDSEPGTSLRAAGWRDEGVAGGGDWNRPRRGGRRLDQPMQVKRRYARVLR
jgi:hypothetical protein